MLFKQFSELFKTQFDHEYGLKVQTQVGFDENEEKGSIRETVEVITEARSAGKNQ